VRVTATVTATRADASGLLVGGGLAEGGAEPVEGVGGEEGVGEGDAGFGGEAGAAVVDPSLGVGVALGAVLDALEEAFELVGIAGAGRFG